MHKFLKAAGFSSIEKRKEYELLIKNVVNEATSRVFTSKDDETMVAEYRKEFAPGIGLAVCGEYNENNQFFFDYMYPYLEGNMISSYEDITIERHADKESYAGVCEESQIGVTLIFYLQNTIQYLRARNSGLLPIKGTSVSLTALSVQGTIMMPLLKNEKDIEKANKAKNSRAKLLEAARHGDEEAIENLTLDDMDTYTAISKKIRKEDIFTIVDTCFMPYGVECDQYSILGEIQDLSLVKNILTNEEIYKMRIICNGLVFDLCINKADLFGEPQIGRRFKGLIWLQGCVNYPEDISAS